MKKRAIFLSAMMLVSAVYAEGLRPAAYTFFTPKELRPQGWVKRQLEIQNTGLAGHLHEMWPDVRDSKWIGGSKEGWERVPYWLDGFIPMAYLLRDEKQIAVARKYIDAILSRQNPDGWICPCSEKERARYDMWACLLITKVLVNEYECSGDPRIEGAVKGALKSLAAHLEKHPLSGWGACRWFEGLPAVYWLYERTGEPWLPALAKTLKKQGLSYIDIYRKEPDLYSVPQTTWGIGIGHGVNIAMSFKASLLSSRTDLSADALRRASAEADELRRFIMKNHGTVIGHFTADEWLGGRSSIRGTELCGVVEAMFSYEQNFAVSGDPKWLDFLETLAFNALPATFSEDMWTHQYDQMVNQIACCSGETNKIFFSNANEAHLFGLEPHYGCCTANFAQGWPKFALSAMMKRPGGVLVASPIPAELSTDVRGVRVTVTTLGEYPFRDSFTVRVTAEKPITFDLELRIPSFVASAAVDGRSAAPGKIVKISRTWKDVTEIPVTLASKPVLVPAEEGLFALRRGALFYAVSMNETRHAREYTRKGVIRKFPYCDYELSSSSKWNYAFAADPAIEFHEGEIGAIPFSGKEPPVTAVASLVEIDWGTEPGFSTVCARKPHSRRPLTPAARVILKPYGCARLRMTALPKQ